MVGFVVLAGAASFGQGRTPGAAALVGLLALAGTAGVLWQQSRDASRGAAIRMGAVAFLLAWAVGGLAHGAFGASDPGREPLRAEATAPAFRDAFYELTVIGLGAPGIGLAVDGEPETLARWYGRAIRPADRLGSVSAIVVQAAGDGPSVPPGAGATRVPWRYRSVLNPAELHALGLARWLVTRQGLFTVQQDDVRVSRPHRG
jgi:hypothetical protein